MAIDPELFRLNRVDDAFHTQPPVGAFEWWYFDAIFDNGYSMVTSWHIDEMGKTAKPESRYIKFAIYDPDGKKTDTEVRFPVSGVVASKETCEVKMGKNHLHGEFPRYEIHFRSDDIGGNLLFENLTQGMRNPPDGVLYFGREPDRYMGWVIAQPRARVAGKLILAGEEIPVNGVGYHDHNWGNVPLAELYDHWHWGRIFLPDHTFLFSTGESAKSLGSQRICVLIAFKGERLLRISSRIDAELSDLRVDKLTGDKYPRKLVLRVTAKNIVGEVILRLKKLIESPAMNPESAKEHRYFRFLSDCDVNLEMEGEKIKAETQVMHELMIP